MKKLLVKCWRNWLPSLSPAPYFHCLLLILLLYFCTLIFILKLFSISVSFLSLQSPSFSFSFFSNFTSLYSTYLSSSIPFALFLIISYFTYHALISIWSLYLQHFHSTHFDVFEVQNCKIWNYWPEVDVRQADFIFVFLLQYLHLKNGVGKVTELPIWKGIIYRSNTLVPIQKVKSKILSLSMYLK